VPDQVDRIPFDPKTPDPTEEPDALPPSNRFVSGVHMFRFGERDVACRFLAFVRDTTGLAEIMMYADRAGTSAKSDSYIDGKDDEEEFKRNRHLPTGGAAEVFYIWLPDEKKNGVGAVYRSYRSPIGGEGTLLDPKNHDAIEKVFRLVDPQPVFQDVILFDVLFWTQWTTHWDWSEAEPVVRGRPTDPSQTKVEPCGPAAAWDSTRGMLAAQQFPLAKGPKSFNFSTDDIWPHAVRISYALAEAETPLVRGISASDGTFTVAVSDFATGHGELGGQFMKIGTEWVQLSGRDGSLRDTFHAAERGARGSVRVAHSAGEPVYYGRVFDFTIAIPSFRDDNN
jgi:hypothetical protein